MCWFTLLSISTKNHRIITVWMGTCPTFLDMSRLVTFSFVTLFSNIHFSCNSYPIQFRASLSHNHHWYQTLWYTLIYLFHLTWVKWFIFDVLTGHVPQGHVHVWTWPLCEPSSYIYLWILQLLIAMHSQLFIWKEVLCEIVGDYGTLWRQRYKMISSFLQYKSTPYLYSIWIWH